MFTQSGKAAVRLLFLLPFFHDFFDFLHIVEKLLKSPVNRLAILLSALHHKIQERLLMQPIVCIHIPEFCRPYQQLILPYCELIDLLKRR